jgi:hypothetical protein
MTQTRATDMQFLFDVNIRYRESMVAMAEPGDAGDLVGSGTGQIDGPKLRGNCGGPTSSVRSRAIASST